MREEEEALCRGATIRTSLRSTRRAACTTQSLPHRPPRSRSRLPLARMRGKTTCNHSASRGHSALERSAAAAHWSDWRGRWLPQHDGRSPLRLCLPHSTGMRMVNGLCVWSVCMDQWHARRAHMSKMLHRIWMNWHTNWSEIRLPSCTDRRAELKEQRDSAKRGRRPRRECCTSRVGTTLSNQTDGLVRCATLLLRCECRWRLRARARNGVRVKHESGRRGKGL